MKDKSFLFACGELFKYEFDEGVVLMQADFEDGMEELNVLAGFVGLVGSLSCFLLLLRLPLLQVLIDESSWKVVTLCKLIIIVDLHLQPVFLDKDLQLLLIFNAFLALLSLALQTTHILDILKSMINLFELPFISVSFFPYSL